MGEFGKLMSAARVQPAERKIAAWAVEAATQIVDEVRGTGMPRDAAIELTALRLELVRAQGETAGVREMKALLDHRDEEAKP